ncbi:Fc.00g058830.m01.CDS01 [Cosmosporella sp. VM-42]
MPFKILILDGGLGTSLEQKYSLKFDRSTPLWSSDLLITDQATLRACQKDFGDVPVDLILTATYQVSVDGFRKTITTGFPDGVPRDEIPRYLDAAVSIAAAVKNDNAGVALSIGPYGACMIPSQEYSGAYDEAHDSIKALEDWHRDRMELFAQIPNLASRVSHIALETIPRADEIVAMRHAISSVPELASLPFWMSILSPGEDMALPDGCSIENAILQILDPAIAPSVPWGIGINCTKVHKLDGLLQIYELCISSMVQQRKIKEWPSLVLYPDGTNGEVYNTTTQKWELPEGTKAPERSWEDQLSETVEATRRRGQWPSIVVGGCCRATCDDIRRLRSILLG